MENIISSNNKSSQKKGSFSKFVPILAGALLIANLDGAIAQNTSNQNRAQAEVSTSTILDRLNQKIGISLPDEYNQKVLDFVLNDTIMRTQSATAYTEDFIINEMKEDWGINKQNQLLFIRSTIYEGISKNNLYDRLDDEDENRSNEYEKSLKLINNSYEKYIIGFNTYMAKISAEARQQSAEARQQSAEAHQQSAEARQQSAEARQQSAEARQQSAEAIKEIMKTDSLGIKEMVKYYNLCIKNPDTNDKNEIESVKKAAKDIIQNCKKYGINYRAILIKEVGGDAKKVDEILKFYGVE